MAHKEIKTHVSEDKKKALAELIKLSKENNTILLASIKNLPAKQFQQICKKLRGQAIVKVTKKTIALMALESIGKPGSQKLKDYVKEDVAIIFSKLDAFKLSGLLSQNKSRAKAKTGQAVNEEVAIEPGPTDLVPGPIISQLTGLGLKFAIADGKIELKERKVILKPGQIVSDAAADIMSKLDIKPVSVGFEPIAAYDSQEDKVFEDIKIDKDKILGDFKHLYSKSLAFAVKIAYPCKDTISYLIGKAGMHEKALSKLIEDSVKAEVFTDSPKPQTQQGFEENQIQGGQ